MTSSNPLLYSHLSYLPVLEALNDTFSFTAGKGPHLRQGGAAFLYSAEHEWDRSEQNNRERPIDDATGLGVLEYAGERCAKECPDCHARHAE